MASGEPGGIASGAVKENDGRKRANGVGKHKLSTCRTFRAASTPRDISPFGTARTDHTIVGPPPGSCRLGPICTAGVTRSSASTLPKSNKVTLSTSRSTTAVNESTNATRSDRVKSQTNTEYCSASPHSRATLCTRRRRPGSRMS